MRPRHILFILGVLILLINPALARHRWNAVAHTQAVSSQPSSAGIYGTSQLESILSNIVNAESSAAIAVYVKSMKYGDTLFTRNIAQPLTPASTMKILTAEAGLIYLGGDYRFSTQLLTDAKTIRNGVLQGNLYVVLSGDPTLTYMDLVELMVTLRTQQITAVQGNVYIDNTAYDQRFYGPGWEWKDKSYCYAAPISASIINHNCLAFKMMPSKTAGRSAQLVKSSNYFYPSIHNTVMTRAAATHSRLRSVSSRSRAGCSIHLGGNASNSLTIDGCMPKGQYAWGVSSVVTDIPEYNRALFRSILNQLAVRVYGTVTFASAPANLSMIGTHSSKPLRVLVNEMLKKSDNVIAGALFKKIGQLYTRRPGSWENGSLAVSQILSKRANVNTSGMRLLDGSGLSAANLATPSQMMQVLDFAFHHSATSLEFITALPIAGVDGTLKHRMGNIAYKVRAKTGTISGVVSLAGYALSAEREPLAFVIMVNGTRGFSWRYRAMEDRIATALTHYKRNS